MSGTIKISITAEAPKAIVHIHVTSDTDGLASKEYVDRKIEEIEAGTMTETDPTVPDWAKAPKKPAYTADEVGAQPKGDYALKSEIPAVPARVSAFENDAGYLTEHQDISGKLDANKLPEAVNSALAQAKASGEFDGADGAPGAAGRDGSNGKDGVSATHSWNGTVLTVTSASGTSSADLKGEPGESADAIPDYVRTEAETIARIVNQHQSGDSVVFPFLADAHCGYYTDTANNAVRLAGQLLHQIGKRVPYDFIANGGDISNGAWNTARTNAYDEIEDYTELTREAHVGVPAVWVPGNHDDAPYRATAERASQTDMFALIGRKNRVSGAVCPNGCNYGYLDLENRRLRVIYLDTHDRRSWGSVDVGSGQECTYLNIENIGGVQLRWLAEQGLDFSDKANPADWGIVVISHAALNADGTWTDPANGGSYAVNTENAATILRDYCAGRSGSIEHNGITVNYDFSALEERAAAICCVHGHNHKFSTETVGGILSIGCPNVMNGRERVSDDGNTYTKTAGTAEGTSFCILTIDRENQLIYADCVGAGYDRQFEYSTEVVAYTNQLPISTDASGNVYNGKGWKENTYLSGGNDGSRDGIYSTGFIPAKGGDTLYFKNVGMQTGQDSHRLCLYDSSKTMTNQVKTTVTQGWWTWGSDGNIAKIFINPTTVPTAAFIRICCSYLGADSIIAVNEEIV